MNQAPTYNLSYGYAQLTKIVTLIIKITIFIICAILITGCASRSGGYYQDDGPQAKVPANIASIPNAVPKIEQHKPANFRPYSVFGVSYSPIAENQSYRQKGIASWYGKKFHGQKTANGEIYDMYAMTAAHPTLPLPSYAKVTRPANGRSVIVRINDRGPFHTDRIIDLSYAAAAKLGLIGPGSGTVIVEAITNNDIRAGKYGNDEKTMVAATTTSVDNKTAASDTDKTGRQGQTEDQVTNINQLVSNSTGNNNNVANSNGNGISKNNIYLQFGAFASSTNAQALAERINRKSGENPEVKRQADLYKVRLGPYSNRNQASQLANQLQAYDLQPTIAVDIEI